MVGFNERNEGCNVIQDDRVRDNCLSLFEGRFSLRGYFGTDFSEISDGCENPDATSEEVALCKSVVSRGVQRIEGGRFAESVISVNNMILALDPDEVKEFKERFPDFFDKLDDVAEATRNRPPSNKLEMADL